MPKQLPLFAPAPLTLDQRVALLRLEEAERAATKPTRHRRSRAVSCPKCGAVLTVPA